MGLADKAGGVDHEEAGPLAERPPAAADAVGVEGRAAFVGEDGERNRELLGQGAGRGEIVRGERENLGPPLAKLSVLIAQPREMPPAKASAVVAQENQDNRPAPPILGQRDAAAGRRRQRELGRGSARRERRRWGGHGVLHSRLGRLIGARRRGT